MTWREYHELTKHSGESLRRTQHYLDWANIRLRQDVFDGPDETLLVIARPEVRLVFACVMQQI
jgi:hypothetical protein